jgi:hypothetical protein
MAKLHFGSSSEFVSMDFPSDFARKGWAQIEAHVAVNCFRGTIAPWVEVKDLHPLLEQLRVLYKTLSGFAEFVPLDGQLTLKIAGDGLGHLQLKGTAWSEARHGNCLEFELGFDQTFLPALIAQLETVLEFEEVRNA